MTDIKGLAARLSLNCPCWHKLKTSRKPCGYDGIRCDECDKKELAAEALLAQQSEIELLKRQVGTLESNLIAARSALAPKPKSDIKKPARAKAKK